MLPVLMRPKPDTVCPFAPVDLCCHRVVESGLLRYVRLKTLKNSARTENCVFSVIRKMLPRLICSSGRRAFDSRCSKPPPFPTGPDPDPSKPPDSA